MEGPLGGMMAEVDGTAGVDRMVGIRVVLESSPLGELLETVLSLSASKLWLILTVRKLLKNMVATW